MTEFQTDFSREVWETTYKHHTDETVDDTFHRVASAIAKNEENSDEWANKFQDIMEGFKVVPGGRILANAGTERRNTTLMNCYVGALPNQNLDSIDGIYKVLVDQANTLKSEGGWGMDFSWIRPRGAFIGGVGVESPGAVRFMELFDKSSDIITSGSGKKTSNAKGKAKIRKGAQMATLVCSHPDIVEFITAKQTQGRLSKFNMSVNCTDEFMALVNLNDPTIDWNLEFPDTDHPKYNEEWLGRLGDWKAKGYPTKVYQTVKVQWLWNLIMESTYNRNEPGVMFLDRANNLNPLSYGETILSTNPCVTGDMVVTVKIDGKEETCTVADAVSMVSFGSQIHIRARNVATEKDDFHPVSFAGLTRRNAEILKITDSSTGKFIKVTPDHRVYTQNRGYVEAKDLNETDVLFIE